MQIYDELIARGLLAQVTDEVTLLQFPSGSDYKNPLRILR